MTAPGSAPRTPARSGTAAVLLAAAVLTLANATKPLVVDDAAYVFFARQIAAHPLDPYGFELLWYESRVPAQRVLAPPLLPYWLGGSIALFGERPLLWKLALFPFAALLAAALHRLLQRFAPGLEGPLLWMALLSPSLVPSFNLMLDVPALALSLAALALFLHACDERQTTSAVGAGVLLALALQAKYTAFVTGGAIGAWVLLHREWRLAAWTGCVALGLFAAWEVFLALRYGTSHFWFHAMQALEPARADRARGWETLGLVAILGAAGPAVAVLTMVARGVRRARVGLALAVGTLAFAIIPLLPAPEVPAIELLPRFGREQPELAVFLPLGLAVALALAWLGSQAMRPTADRDFRFLVLWLGIELAGVFVTSPFLALRRVIGPLVAMTLAAGAMTARARGATNLGSVRLVAAWGVALAALFAATDLCDARTRRQAAVDVTGRLAELGADPSRDGRWFTGHWTFRYYAEREGLQSVVPGETRLRAGDWLVLPDGVSAQHLRAPRAFLRNARFVGVVEAADPWPWSSIPSAYAGPLPLRAQPEFQIRARLYRVRNDFVP